MSHSLRNVESAYELLFLKIVSGLISMYVSTEYYQYVDIQLLKLIGSRVILTVVGVKVSERRCRNPTVACLEAIKSRLHSVEFVVTLAGGLDTTFWCVG